VPPLIASSNCPGCAFTPAAAGPGRGTGPARVPIGAGGGGGGGGISESCLDVLAVEN